jgi:hypothetical protein
MAPNSLSPASLKIEYTSAFGAHSMTIPTLAFNPVALTGGLGSYECWDLTTIDGEYMVNELVNALRPFHPSTNTFVQATAYTQATPTSPNIPRAAVALTQVGTAMSTNFSEAVSVTFNFKTEGNGDFKLVNLDCPYSDDWLHKILPADFNTEIFTVAGIIVDPARAWSGRDDQRVTILRNLSYDVNDRLQKAYFK